MKKPNINMAKLADAKWIGYVAAGVTAVAAFASSLQDQKKEKLVADLAERVAKLEKK